MMRIRSKLLALAALGLVTVTASADPLKVGFVYVGPVGDAGWSYSHDQGRLALEKNLGDKVKTTYVESVPEGADAARVIRQLAASGNQLIFSTSFGYMNPTLQVAKMFPNVKFEHATGYRTAPNMGVYEARTYEGSYLLGVLAGSMTTSDTLGFVASFPIPEVLRNINAFTLGAQSVKPGIKTKVIWVNTWYDPGKERQAAETLIAQGADILCQNTDSPATLQVAAEKGKHACGWDSDMSRFAPKAQMSASVLNWGPFYTRTAEAVINGSWKSEAVKGGIADDMIVMAPLSPDVPEAGKKAFDTAIASLKDGSFAPFQGPLKAQDGTIKAKAGERLSEKDLMSMNWYVAGVEGSLPK